MLQLCKEPTFYSRTKQILVQGLQPMASTTKLHLQPKKTKYFISAPHALQKGVVERQLKGSLGMKMQVAISLPPRSSWTELAFG